MKSRMTVFFFGLAVGYRAGNAAAYWYLRARARREQAEAIRGLRQTMAAFADLRKAGQGG